MPSTSSSTGQTDAEAKARFSARVGPCLALVAPTGMSQDERRIWMGAAYAALKHLPDDLLAEGAAEALRSADHPSKIVATITKTVQGRFEARQDRDRRDRAHRLALAEEAERNRQLMLPGEVADPVTTAKILDEAWPSHRRYDPGVRATQPMGLDPDRPTRAPTREDYIRLGVDPSTLDAIAAERE